MWTLHSVLKGTKRAKSLFTIWSHFSGTIKTFYDEGNVPSKSFHFLPEIRNILVHMRGIYVDNCRWNVLWIRNGTLVNNMFWNLEKGKYSSLNAVIGEQKILLNGVPPLFPQKIDAYEKAEGFKGFSGHTDFVFSTGKVQAFLNPHSKNHNFSYLLSTSFFKIL